MKEIVKLSGILTIITLVAAGALARVFLMTRDLIAAVEAEREESARRAALPGAVAFKPDTTADGFVYFRAYADQEASGNPVGYVGLALGKGYSSQIRTMVGVSPQLEIIGIKVAFQQETPGLGTRVEEVRKGDQDPWFQTQFKGRTSERLAVQRSADSNGIEAITGATISSRAVATSVRETIKKMGSVLR
ncbi:MAG: FMN-binding protein [Candidatus Glassbacteria bacterium]